MDHGQDGDFLLRRSTRKRISYVLCLLASGHVCHFEIQRQVIRGFLAFTRSCDVCSRHESFQYHGSVVQNRLPLLDTIFAGYVMGVMTSLLPPWKNLTEDTDYSVCDEYYKYAFLCSMLELNEPMRFPKCPGCNKRCKVTEYTVATRSSPTEFETMAR